MDDNLKNLNKDEENNEDIFSEEGSFTENDTEDFKDKSNSIGELDSRKEEAGRDELVSWPINIAVYEDGENGEQIEDAIEDLEEDSGVEGDNEYENPSGIIEPKKRRLKKSTRIIIIIIIILGAIAFVKYFNNRGWGNSQGGSTIYATIIERERPHATEYDVVQSLITENATKTYFRTDGNSFFYCTRDGIKHYSDMDTLKWTDIYTLASPCIITEEGRVAVTETSSKTVRVYSKSGPEYSVNTEGTIVQAALNKNGYLALILKNNDGYSVQVYDSAGTLMKERVDKMKGIYPVAVDVSKDNRILAVSYFDTTDVVVKSSIAFLYIDSAEGSKYMDSVYKTLDYEEQIIPWINFMKGNELFCVSDTELFIVSEEGAEGWSIPLGNEVDSVYKYDDKRVIIAYGDKLVNREGKSEGTICWYNVSGNEEGSFECGDKITYVSANKEGIVAGCGNVYKGISYSGKCVWQIVATQTVDDVCILDKINKVLYVKRGCAEILKMR